MNFVDMLALKVAEKLRLEPCQHGLPERVVSATPVQPWGEGATCKPLCDACVSAAVREAFESWDWKADMGVRNPPLFCTNCRKPIRVGDVVAFQGGSRKYPIHVGCEVRIGAEED